MTTLILFALVNLGWGFLYGLFIFRPVNRLPEEEHLHLFLLWFLGWMGSFVAVRILVEALKLPNITTTNFPDWATVGILLGGMALGVTLGAVLRRRHSKPVPPPAPSLRVFYDGDSTYAATDMADATHLWEEQNGCLWLDEHGENEPPEAIWEERPLDKLTSINFDHQADAIHAAPPGAEIVSRPNGGYQVRASWKDWAAKTGRGIICSENW